MVDPLSVHSAMVVLSPSVGQEHGQAELQEGDREVALQGEEEEEAFLEACPLQGGENSLEMGVNPLSLLSA